jgi:hypothetical protein
LFFETRNSRATSWLSNGDYTLSSVTDQQNKTRRYSAKPTSMRNARLLREAASSTIADKWNPQQRMVGHR